MSRLVLHQLSTVSGLIGGRESPKKTPISFELQSEVRGRKTEVGRQKSEVRRKKTEVGGQRAEDRISELEIS